MLLYWRKLRAGTLSKKTQHREPTLKYRSNLPNNMQLTSTTDINISHLLLSSLFVLKLAQHNQTNYTGSNAIKHKTKQ